MNNPRNATTTVLSIHRCRCSRVLLKAACDEALAPSVGYRSCGILGYTTAFLLSFPYGQRNRIPTTQSPVSLRHGEKHYEGADDLYTNPKPRVPTGPIEGGVFVGAGAVNHGEPKESSSSSIAAASSSTPPSSRVKDSLK